MHGQNANPQQLKAQLATHQNPYLYLDECGTVDSAETQAATLERKLAYFRTLQEPCAYYDIFGDPDDSLLRAENLAQAPLARDMSSCDTTKSFDGVVISRGELENLLDAVLDQYRPFVAKKDWGRVISFRGEFLDEATRTPALTQRVARRLESFRLSLMPGEKVEYNRAPADQILRALRRLLS